VFNTGGLVARPVAPAAKIIRSDTKAAVPGALIRFKINDKDVGQAMSKPDGMAQVFFNLGQDFAPGKYPLTATFDGNNYFQKSSAAGIFTVNRGTVTITLEARNPAPAGAPLHAFVVVHDAAGQPVARRELQCTLNGKVKSIKTHAGGRAPFNIGISPGANIIKVDFPQDALFDKAHCEFTIMGKVGT
jgi:hypothetical protein